MSMMQLSPADRHVVVVAFLGAMLWVACDGSPTVVPGDCVDGSCADAGADACEADCADSCGDGVCDAATEDQRSCPADCPTGCGDGQCVADDGEDDQTCPVDCGPRCGDGVCAPSESANCAQDCGHDLDSDGVVDRDDNCPRDANPHQMDSDQDGAGDVCDVCPLDPDNDTDDDGVCGDTDNCAAVANRSQEDTDADGAGDACDPCPSEPGDDADGDAVCQSDNCPVDPNTDQSDTDEDGAGDACDRCPLDALDDVDDDGLCADVDNCPDMANPEQVDSDRDGLGNVCDTCPFDPDGDADEDGVCARADNCPDVPNPDQHDSDEDGTGDLCDVCPSEPDPDQIDEDLDGVGDACDVCPAISDPDQLDHNGDGVGFACQDDDDADGVGRADDSCPDYYNPRQHTLVEWRERRDAFSASTVLVGHFNADGEPDVFATDLFGTSSRVYLTDGEGGVVTVELPSATTGAVGDFNGDGLDDMYLGRADIYDSDPFVQVEPAFDVVMLSDGNGRFAPVYPRLEARTFAASAADIDEDGNLDVVITTFYGDSNYVLLGDGQGRLTHSLLSSVPRSQEVRLADLNADGHVDAVFPTGALLGDGAGGFAAVPNAMHMGVGWTLVRLGDVDGDGDLDIYRTGYSLLRVPDRGAELWLNQGDATFVMASQFELPREAGRVAIADFNGDAIPDVFVPNAGSEPGTSSVQLGLGSGRFGTTRVPFGYNLMLAFAAADMNGDGFVDIVAGGARNVTVWLNTPGEQGPCQ